MKALLGIAIGATLLVVTAVGRSADDGFVPLLNGNIDRRETFDHAGGNLTSTSTAYEQDVALRIVRSD